MNKFYTAGNAGSLLPLSSVLNATSVGSSLWSINHGLSTASIHPSTIINQSLPLNCTSMNTDTTNKSTMLNFFTVNYRRFAGNAVAKILMGMMILLGSIMTTNAQNVNHLVISQVYGGGGNAGATYTNDFVEIFNPTGASVTLTGWKIQYASATGAFADASTLTGSIAAGKYYLISLANGGAVGSALPSADATGTTNMSATAGKVQLINASASVIDLFGFGTASSFEGTVAPALSGNVNSYKRNNNGCTDANNNSSDFTNNTTASARNSSTGANYCYATKLSIPTPATQTAGTGFSLTITAQDAGGNTKAATTSTLITLTATGSTIGGTVTGTITAGTSTVTISGITLTASASVTLTATATSGDALTAATSNAFAVNVASAVPTKFVITAIAPTTPTAGAGFSVTVQSQDGTNVAGNVSANTSFNLTTNSNAGAIGGTTTGTIAAGSSSVTVSGVTLASGGTGATITATRSAGDNLTAATSAVFNVFAAAPTITSTAIVFGSQTTATIPITSLTPGNGSNRIVVQRLASASVTAPVNGTNYAVNSTLGSGTVIFNGSGSGPVTATGLTAATQYSFDIYEYNGGAGSANYGSVFSASRYTLATEPTSHSATFTSSALTGTSVTLNFTASSTTLGYIIIQKTGATASTGTPVDGTGYAVGNALGDGTVAAVVITTTTTASISSLTANSQYTFSIIPFGRNTTNTETYNYYTAATIPTLTVSTPATTPTAQPTALTFGSVGLNSFTVAFTAATGSPTGYIVLRNTGSAPTGAPVSSNVYTVGNTNIGGGTNTVVYVGGTPSPNFAQSGLTEATTYFYTVFSYNGTGASTSYLATSPLAGSQATLSVSAPTATAATNITNNSFVANWGTSAGAASYRLDVSAVSTFSQPLSFNENFENTLTNFTATGTGTYFSGSSASGDRPATSPFAAAGTYSYGVNSGTAILTSNTINTSGSTGINLSFRLASFSIGSSGNGADGTDLVTVEVSPDGGATYFNTVQVLGNSNAYWAYSATGVASTVYDGDATPVDFTPAGGGPRTGDGYSTVNVTGLPATSNLKIRITLLNNASAELWTIDNFTITGTQGSFIAGFNNLNVGNVTTYPVTGLTPTTAYYYRVRAVGASSTSVNSNTITATTYTNAITNADFQTKVSGFFSNPLLWQYNTGNAGFVDANQVPTSTNNITVLNGHQLALNADYTVGAGKTFTIATGGSLLINPTNNLEMADVTSAINFNGQSVTVRSASGGTGSIGKMLGTLSGATNVTVERYMPVNAFRAYRLLSVPTSGQTIKAAWQEGLSNGATGTDNLGTQITGSYADAVTNRGFDAITPGTSMFSYNATAKKYEAILNTTTQINTQQGWLIYIRGDRRDNATNTSINPTTLRTTGTLKSGTLAPVSVAANQYAVVGNPYASAIDLRRLSYTGTAVGNNITVWDPKLGGTGGYQLLTSDGTNYRVVTGGGSYGAIGNAVNTIQSGQAFFIEAGSVAGSVTIGESSKVTGSVTTVFRPSSPAATNQDLYVNLYSISGGVPKALDGVLVSGADANSNAIDNFDASKQNNFTENLGLKSQGVNLSIERRKPFVNNDTVFLTTTSLRRTTYQLYFEGVDLDPNVVATLEDNYLNTKTLVNPNGNSTYDFTVDANAGSAAANRFRVVFKELGSGPLPVTFTNIKAAEQGNNIAVEWKVGSQLNISSYDVEKSTDGRSFTKVATIQAANTTTYNWLDVAAVQGNNFYRVKATDINIGFKYTQIVKITLGKKGAAIAVLSNPVQGNVINLQFTNQAAGKYQVRLINTAGQLMYTNTLQHAGGSSSQTITLSSQITKGVYQLEIVTPDKTRKAQKLIVE